MTPDQVQAIVNMKLTRQDMGTILQQQGITFGGRGGSGTPERGRRRRWIRWRRRWNSRRHSRWWRRRWIWWRWWIWRSGGATPNPQVIATYRARAASGAANAGLVRLVIRFLQQKNPALAPSATPAACYRLQCHPKHQHLNHI